MEFAEFKQLMKQYFFLLNGKRAMTGNFDLATYDIKFNDVLLDNSTANTLKLMNHAKTAYKNFTLGNIRACSWYATNDSAVIRTNPSTGRGEMKWQGYDGGWLTCLQLGTHDVYDASVHIPRAGDITMLDTKVLSNATAGNPFGFT